VCMSHERIDSFLSLFHRDIVFPYMYVKEPVSISVFVSVFVFVSASISAICTCDLCCVCNLRSIVPYNESIPL
jgi:hypothetical protein